MSNPTPAPISQRAFARILGVSPPAVGKAIKTGRLKDCLFVDEAGVAKIANVDLARREWASSTDYSKAPTAVKEQAAAREAATSPTVAPPPPSLGDLPEPAVLNLNHENAREKHWRANKAEIEYLERIGQLVDAAEMQGLVADAFTRVRARLGGLPTRVRQQIPHLTTEEVGVIESFVREALDELVLKLEDEDEDLGEETDAGASPSDGA